MLHRRYSILFTLLMACLSVMGQVRDIVIKDGAYYSTASLPVDTVHNQSFEKDSIYLIVPRDAQIAYPDYNNRAQLIIWQSGRPIYALPITQYDSLSYVRMLQGDTLRTIFSQQAGSLPIYGKRPIVWQHGQVTVTDSAQVLADDIYQSVAQGDYANFIIQPTEIVRDTQYILCIRDTVYKVQDIYDDTDDVDSIPSVDTIPPTPGRRIGVFSVAADKQVSFSQGNLQYIQSTDTWQFASEQYEYFGADNIQDGELADRIDLFGWSTDNPLSKWGLVFVSNNDYYHGSFVDWGVNTISGDAPNTWRTLSIEEWKYLLKTRPTSNMRYTYGNINGINGVLLFPDHWSSIDGISLTFSNQYQTNTLSLAQWELLENSGVVFLPSCGVYMGKIYNHPNTGLYWSSTAHPSNEGYALSIYITGSIQEWGNNRATNRSVRLVHDTIVPMPEPEYVDLGLSVKWATFNVGARAPEDYGDYFAWGETEPKTNYDWSTYKWCDGTANTFTKYCSDSAYGNADFKTILDPSDDAAQVYLGGNWRMPTIDEWRELHKNCSWKKSIINGITGYQVTAKNGNSIFLPRAGLRTSGILYAVDSVGYYASNTHLPNFHGEQYASYWLMYDNSISSSSAVRKYGLTIRPVYDDTPPAPAKRIGVFSVAKDKQVSFSQGNLQYIQSTNLWRFAENQYDYLGEENVKEGELANRIDLFGWSANNTTALFGVSMSTNNADYAGEFVDWGENIINSDVPNTWRTLTNEEWEYLIKGRKNASNLRAAAQVNGVNGMILLPDDWECPEGIDFKAGYHTSKGSEYYAEYQQFTKEQWRELETTGAIFLPAAGMHDGGGIADVQSGGYYWSATAHETNYAYTLLSQSTGAYVTYDNRYDVRSVRLVHDTIVPPPAPCETFEVNGVTFNMMCVEGGTMNIGRADSMYYRQRPERTVTVSDYYIGQTEVTQELWQAVMGENPSKFQCDTCIQHPVDSVSIIDVQLFIQKLNLATGKHFRLPTEEEWEFAARGGTKSKGFLYSGSDICSEVAWYGVADKNGGTTHPVAQLKPNELGLYDMHGNLWEWVHNKYTDTINIYPSYNPTGPEGKYKGIASACGSGYYSGLDLTRTWGWVGVGSLTTRSNWFGFRLALSDKNPFVAVEVNDYRFHMMLVEGETYDYYIGQTEVTQGLWKKVMGYNNSIHQGDDLPVEKVSWEECQTFIQKLNEMTGKHFRLPTEAEWEYAARGGKNSHGYTYAGSNSIDSVAWYQANSQEQTHTIATLMPNELGIYDMSGNVWEWCQDYYDASTQRVVRSGSFYDVASVCRISSRGGRDANYRSYIGLRLVLDEHEYVDLGLSVMWATTNVGAESAEEYGDYFAWGETEPKETYSWATYKWCDGTENNMTKYNATDGLKTLLPEDDAAHVNWGGEWRMASDAEFQELIDNCVFEITNHNGVKGTWVTSKINGNRIFIPYAGYYNHGNGGTADKNYSSQQRLWTSSSISIASHAKNYCNQAIESNTRRCGFPIRPVVSAGRDIQIPPTPGKRIGVFSVAKDKQVSFSQGNLQYTQSKNQWRFAENQYDYLGEENVKDGELANRIDLFGWSANNTTALFGVSTSTNNADYAGEFVDWGTNIIQGDAANTWRTMSADEWEFLLEKRKNASNLYGVAKVAGENGLIILPDDWKAPEGIIFKAGLYSSQVNDFSVYQSFTADEWKVMEEAGAVFLHASGYRDGATVEKCNTSGYYWSNTTSNDDDAYRMYFYSYFLGPKDVHSKYRGRSVRLVHDTIVPPPAPCQTFEVKGVTFNMMCVEGGTFSMGEGRSDAHLVTLSDYYIGETEVTCGLWKAVMDSLPASQSKYPDDYPVAHITLADCREFVERLSKHTGRHFRVPTEAEWEYAARGGKYSLGFAFAGSDDINEVAYWQGNVNRSDNGNIIHRPAPVKSRRPNELGTYDMTGNLCEWVSDWHAAYNTYPQINPTGPAVPANPGYPCHYRGGCWTYTEEESQNTYRHGFYNRGANGIGLRLAMSDEEPFRAVYINDTTRLYLRPVKGETYDYHIGETEITTTQWKAVMGSLPKLSQTLGAIAVSNVTWFECQEFIQKLSELTGLHFRFPTIDEWNYAAKGGEHKQNFVYSGSNHIDSVGWYNGNSVMGIQPVAQLMPNALGVYDMTGNVWEWLAVDSRGRWPYYGGSYAFDAEKCKLSNAKGYNSTPDHTGSIGLRVVLDTAEYVSLHTTPAKRIGVFSVAKGKQVSFSQGNLQYNRMHDKWHFAANQYDYIGEDNIKDGQLANRIDLFGWSGDSGKAPWGVSTSTNNADYAGDFVDWGTNIIQGDSAGIWRTLSKDEWNYLINERKDAAQLYGAASVNGINGLVILPDADMWVCPSGISFTCGMASADGSQYFQKVNNFTAAQWTAMENAGAVFLTACGVRFGLTHKSEGVASSTWTSTPISKTHAYLMNFHSHVINIGNTMGDYQNGRSVRLVHDTIVPPPAPCQTFEVKGVTFNMMCVEGGTFVMGSDASSNEKPMHQVTIPDFLIGQTEVTQELWQVVMGNNPSHFKGAENPVEYVSWSDCQKFIANLNQLTGKNFRLPTEAEWEYAARGGQMSKDFVFSGSDNVDKVGWYTNNSGAMSHPVKQKLPNELGIYDMSGNVWEWCQDWYGDYSTDTQINPQGPSSGSVRVIRGGSWMNDANDCRVSRRLDLTPAARTSNLGLRLVHDTIVPKVEPEYVDLGLSVKWATFNVGASKPEDYGDYFAWGETEPKETYSWANYKWCDGAENSLTKYCTNSQYGANGFTDNKTILEPEDDAARVHWGEDWRMPSDEEMTELREKCTWTWTTRNAIEGYIIEGPNGNSIFLPAAGFYFVDGYRSYGNGDYWSTKATNTNGACHLYFYSDHHSRSSSYRYFGFPIRPVYVDRPPKRIGVFSVGAGKKVSFSQGNLQYIQSTDTWQFAANQLEYMGHKHYRNGQLADTIEYFGWSGKNSKAPWGISLSTESSDYAGEFLDWGTNSISGDTANTWRTLSNEELLYICQGRKNADQLLGLGTIGAVTGLIILPDDWQLPAGLSFTPNTDNATKNQYTFNQWAVMEKAGAVFIATSGYFNPKLGGMRHVGGEGHIRTNALSDNGLQVYSVIKTNKIIYSYSGTQEQNLQYAFAQRLVHDTIVPTPEPEYVDLGLSVKWATFNVGAKSPEDCGDYFAWGETGPKEEYTWATYKWGNGTSAAVLTKYNTQDGKTILEPEDDAAHVHWGNNWRVPTDEEYAELRDLCTWTWTTMNNVKGYEVKGPNGNSIFLPTTGYMTDTTLKLPAYGYYWSNSLYDTNLTKSNTNYFSSHPASFGAYLRIMGFAIRPVYDDRPKSKIIWYTDEAIKGEGKSVSITNTAGFAYLHPEGEQSTELNRRYQGKRINCIRLQVAQAGSFTVSVANRDRLDSIFNIQTIMLKDPSKEPQVYHLPQTIHLQKNQVLVFANPTDQGRFYYSAYIENITFYGLIGQKGVDIARDRTLHIDAGYYCEDGENCDTLAILEPEYVDLGLSVKWATFNVGATSPEEYGDYFAWGETEPKENYNWATYKWCDGTSTNMTKYNTIDGKTILEPTDDAAQVHRGDKWRMPTKAECQELIDSCTWEWTTSNNVSGYRVTGPNGNSIFLPAGGVRIDNASYAIGEFGYYWSSSLMIDSISHAHSIVFTPTSKSCDSDLLYRGRKIRPVYDDR